MEPIDKKKTTSSTTIPILGGLVISGDLQAFKLKTIEDTPSHAQLTLVFPSGRELVIDTASSGNNDVGIIIDNAAVPSKLSEGDSH